VILTRPGSTISSRSKNRPTSCLVRTRPKLPFAAQWAERLAGEWPLHSFLELGALDGAVPSARLHARHILREWGQAALADDAELVVSGNW
jgi:hypothetical protein